MIQTISFSFPNQFSQKLREGIKIKLVMNLGGKLLNKTLSNVNIYFIIINLINFVLDFVN